MTEHAQNEHALPTARPILSAKEFLGCKQKSLKRKEDSSRFPSSCVPVSLRCRTSSAKLTPFRNINLIPFRTDATSHTSAASRHSRALAYGLGATHPCPIAVHTEPFSTSVFKDYT